MLLFQIVPISNLVLAVILYSKSSTDFRFTPNWNNAEGSR